MDLWIRSQDKMKLIQNSKFFIEVLSDCVWIEDVSDDKCHWKLAEYATKKRALEVLDEIQSKIATLNFQNHFIGTDFNIIESNIYQMPEE